MGLSALSGGAPACSCLHVFLRIGVAVALCVCASLHAAESGENRFDAVIVSVAESYQVDPLLIKALIWHESRFNPVAEGKAGEIGLMQIKMMVVRDWAKARGVALPLQEDLFDPYLNIEIGTWYFARAFTKWRNSKYGLLLALGEYNAGPARVQSWIRRANGNKARAISKSASATYVRSIRNKYLEYTLLHAKSVASVGASGGKNVRR